MKELKRLRGKFVFINMTIVTVILLVMGLSVLTVTRGNLQRQSVDYLRRAAKEDFSYTFPNMGQGGHRNEVNLPYFTLYVDNSGTSAVLSDRFGALENTEQLKSILTRCMSQPESMGELSEYHLRYLRSETLLGWRITFVDSSYEHLTLRTLATYLSVIGLATLAVFLFLSVRLAEWATRPVEESWKRQRQFVSDASHELKTPLTVILSNLDLLDGAKDTENPAKARWLDNIRAASGQMTELVEGLLTLARFDNQTAVAVKERFDLSELAEEEALLYEPVLFEAEKTLEEHIEENIFVTGDPSKLRRLMTILLDNARKYAENGSVVTLTLAREGNKKVRLSVNTKGDVITAEELPRLFERFYRAEKSRTSEGYGLGLSIAAKIAEEHGGKIWAESDAEAGNTFVFELVVRD